jgi:ABC-type branched-subunit amino acid transport system substrate-binding protein
VRVLALCVAVVLASCANNPIVTLPTPLPTREPGVLSVSVLLDLSGPRAPSGQPQRNAMQIWVDQPSTSGVKLRVKFVDVAGSDSRLLLELRRAVVDDRADAIVIGVPVALDETLQQAAQVASVPILLTPPVPEPASSAGGRFVFALAPTPASIAKLLVDDLVARSLLTPTLLAGDETPAAVVERSSFLAELRRRTLVAPTPVRLGTAESAQRVKSAATVAKSIVLVGASAPYGDVIRTIPVTPDSPRVYLSYLTETADVTNLRDQAALATWPGSRAMAAQSSPTAQQRAFVQQFTDRHGAPSTLAATAYDALALIESAAAAGPSELDAARLRLRLETTTFAGLVTKYSFTSTRHVGFSLGDLAVLRWNAQRGTPVLP